MELTVTPFGQQVKDAALKWYVVDDGNLVVEGPYDTEEEALQDSRFGSWAHQSLYAAQIEHGDPEYRAVPRLGWNSEVPEHVFTTEDLSVVTIQQDGKIKRLPTWRGRRRRRR